MEKVKQSFQSKIAESEVVPVSINADGDCIYLMANDSQLLDKFASGYSRIAAISDEMTKKVDEIGARYAKDDEDGNIKRVVEISRVNNEFSKECVGIIDDIFGEGTMHKYFKSIYEKIPTFVPNADCINEFFENMTPVLEDVYHQKIEASAAKRKAAVAKYQPQDHKKPASKK